MLIGSGVRISEALALRISDLELDDSGGVIVVYRSRKKASVGSTKSDRFRSVEIGPRTSLVLRTSIAQRRDLDTGLADDGLVFVMPVRGAKRSQGRWQSAGVAKAMDRTTVSRDWHKQALQDAALRDMPLHALRHTAAASWLAAGNSLMYVQRQLGHADIGTTERYYGHLERHVLAAGAIADRGSDRSRRGRCSVRAATPDPEWARPTPGSLLEAAPRSGTCRDTRWRARRRATAPDRTLRAAAARRHPPAAPTGCVPFAPPRKPKPATPPTGAPHRWAQQVR